MGICAVTRAEFLRKKFIGIKSSCYESLLVRVLIYVRGSSLVKKQLRNDDLILLKQKIIYYQSELDIYKRKVQEFEKYKGAEEIKRLIEQNKELKLSVNLLEEKVRDFENLKNENLELKKLITNYNLKNNDINLHTSDGAPESSLIKETWFYHNLINNNDERKAKGRNKVRLENMNMTNEEENPEES